MLSFLTQNMLSINIIRQLSILHGICVATVLTCSLCASVAHVHFVHLLHLFTLCIYRTRSFLCTSFLSFSGCVKRGPRRVLSWDTWNVSSSDFSSISGCVKHGPGHVFISGRIKHEPELFFFFLRTREARPWVGFILGCVKRDPEQFFCVSQDVWISALGGIYLGTREAQLRAIFLLSISTWLEYLRTRETRHWMGFMSGHVKRGHGRVVYQDAWIVALGRFYLRIHETQARTIFSSFSRRVKRGPGRVLS